jgi:LmbE family N-acetylglucosaminyl deacetylase
MTDRAQAPADAQLEVDTPEEALSPAAFETPADDMPKIALVVVAHPDDAELGCGGTVAVWARQGWEVTFCIVTDASGGGDDHAADVSPGARKRISETRKREQQQAGEVLELAGVEFLDYPDGLVVADINLRRDLVRVIRRIKPSVVFCQSPDRRWDPFFLGRHHPDHLAVGEATLAAIYPAARNAWDFPELLADGLLPHRVREVYIMGAPAVNHWVDITDGLDHKLAALRAHDSQLGARFAELERNLRQRLGEVGARYGVGFAEEFLRVEAG